MKIAVISSTVFPCPPAGYAGLEQLAYQVATGLAGKGHEVALIAPDTSQCPGGTVISTGPAGQHDEKMAFRRYKDDLKKFDVIIDNSWQKFSYLLKIQGSLKAPVLGVVHAPINTMYQSLPPVEKPSFVCISQDQANHFEALFSREARVAHNGIDLNFYKEIGIKRTSRFLFLARFSSIKGPDLAIQACKEAGVELDLVGDISITQEPDYLEQCKKMCDGVKIKFVGPATRSECVFWFSQAHAFLHPNMRFREPAGLAPREAMACGLPVAAWRYGAMKESIRETYTGFLASSYQEFVAHVRLMANPIADDIRKYCREWASQFSVDKMIDRYEKLAIEAVDTGGW